MKTTTWLDGLDMKHEGYGCTLPLECGYNALLSLNIGRRQASVCYINKQLVVMGRGLVPQLEKAQTLTLDSSYLELDWSYSSILI